MILFSVYIFDELGFKLFHYMYFVFLMRSHNFNMMLLSRENLGKYAIGVRRLSLEIMEAIVESLGLPPTYLRSSLEKGMHMIVGNKYHNAPHQATYLD